MKSIKNKNTQENREFWTHVESVAERVRSCPAYANFKMIDKASGGSSSKSSNSANSPKPEDGATNNE
jgi:hypothetical protein